MSRTLALLSLTFAGSAWAQDANVPDRFDAHNLFVAAYDGDLRDPLRVSRPGRFRQWDWFAGGVLEYVHAPFVRYDVTSPDGDLTRTNIVDHLTALNISAGVAFHERIRLDVTAPIFFTSFNANNDYQGVGFGDIRATATVPIVLPNESDEGFGLAVHGKLDIPSGAQNQYLGNQGVAGGGTLSLSYAVGVFTASAEGGVHFKPSVDLDNHQEDDIVTAGAGVGVMVHPTTSLNLEGTFEAPFRKNQQSLTSSPIELTLTARHRRPSGFHLLAGAAAGVTRGVGAARVRAFLGAGYGKVIEAGPRDADEDGILDKNDLCPDDPETYNTWKDDDGCPDDLATLRVSVEIDGNPVQGAEVTLSRGDETPDERFLTAETATERADLEPVGSVEADAVYGSCYAGQAGLQLQEGMNDLVVPLAPVRPATVRYEITGPDGQPVDDAVATWRVAEEGCAEADGYVIGTDGTAEHPMGVGTHTVFVDAPGYRIHREEVAVEAGDTYVVRAQMERTKIEVGKKEIRILEKVYFDFDSDRIKQRSFSLLDEVADTILANEVGRVQVEGHTDSKGTADYNRDLSQRRAEAVLDYLVARGVPRSQLIARGFGEDEPVADNSTEAGRAKNRRVVFKLIDRDSQTIETEAR